MRSIRVVILTLTGFGVAVLLAWQMTAHAAAGPVIHEADLRQFMDYISSDQLLGRQTFTEGNGLAAGYVAAHLGEWGVKPLGERGTYLQTVTLNDVKVESDRSVVTVEVAGQTRTFRNGEDVQFTAPVGGTQTLTFTGAEFLGYGLYMSGHDDYAGRDVRGRLALWVASTPANLPASASHLLSGRARHAVAEVFAGASLSYLPDFARRRAAAAPPPTDTSIRPPRLAVSTVLGAPARGDFRTTEDLDKVRPPQIAGDDAFFDFLFSNAPTTFAQIKDLAARQEPLPAFSLSGVKVTITVDATYKILQTFYTHNVVGMIEGRDPRLRDTYVMFGAHLDHIGYLPAPRAQGPNGLLPGPGQAGACPNAAADDVINNGADDDGSGVVTEMAIAKAFATGPKPKRSLVFIWHAGEEMGLYGSEYNADHPVVPLDTIDVQLNMDMIGRDNLDDRAGDYSNSVFIVGDDRISTELHNLIVDVNARMTRPLTLDYGMNDPADPETVYYRSDHYSYASKGIPIAFFTTGLHDDYHCLSDTADKIHYAKMARIGQLVYETGLTVGNSAAFVSRDNRGPRSGRGFQGKIQ